jgi:hypothetical protein
MAEYTIARGADHRILITITESGAPIDLTGRAITFTAKRSREDATPLLQKTVGNGIALLTQSGGTLGQCVVSIVPADTTSLPRWSSVLYYDVWLVDAGGQQHQTEDGLLLVEPSITP